MKHNEQGPMENLLDGIDEHADALTLDQLRDEAAARGIDLDRALAAVNNMIAERCRDDRLSWMKVADERRESLRVGEAQEEYHWRSKSPQEIAAAFEDFLNLAPAQTALAFRKKGTLSTSDMVQILEANERLKRASHSGS
jgi:hypothetical protein